MDAILGYSPMDEAFETRLARLELFLVAGGSLGFLAVMALRSSGRTQAANLLTVGGVLTGGVVGMIRVANQHARTIARMRASP